MKEYDLFVEKNGDMQLYLGGQFQLGANNLGAANNLAELWKNLETMGERIVELREMDMSKKTGERTFKVNTLSLTERVNSSLADRHM